MTKKNKERLALALDNASEMIGQHAEAGLEPEDVDEIDEEGLEEYVKACQRAEKLIKTLANKYKQHGRTHQKRGVV